MENHIAEKITERLVLVSLKISQWGNRTKIGNGSTNGLPSDLVHEIGNLVDPDNLGLPEIMQVGSEARSYLYEYSFKYGIDGVNIITRKMVPQIHEKLQSLKVKFDALVAKAVETYEAERARIAEKYPDYYNLVRDKYPVNLADKFAMSWRFFPVDTQELGAEELDPGLVAESNAQIRESLYELRTVVVSELRARILEAADHLFTKVSNGEVFKSSTVEKLRDRLESFDKMNVWSDQSLAAEVAKAKAILAGVTDPDSLRDGGYFQKQFTAKMGEVVDNLKELKDENIRLLLF